MEEEKRRFKEKSEYSEWYTARQSSKSAGEHYSVALIDVEECCSALHVQEKAKRIQLVPEHRVCLRLCTVSRVGLSGWTAKSPSNTRGRRHVYVRWAQGQARKAVGVIKRWAGFTRPLIAPSPFRLIYLQSAGVWAVLCGLCGHLQAVIQDFKGTKRPDCDTNTQVQKQKHWIWICAEVS